MADLSFLCHGEVFHNRKKVTKNSFTYKQHYIVLQAKQKWVSPFPWLKINSVSLFSFQFKNYGRRDGTNPFDYMTKILKENCHDTNWLKDIYVLTQPSILGWVFNPVSFWFYTDNNNKLRAVLAEVNNTFGGHHKYFLHKKNFDIINEKDTMQAKKVFFVSPFFDVSGKYQFNFAFSLDRVSVSINYIHENQSALIASLNVKKVEMNYSHCSRMTFSHLKTVVLILWQALRLVTKKIKFRRPV